MVRDVEVRKRRSTCVEVPKSDNRENGKETLVKHGTMPENFLELLKDTNH